MNRIIPSLPQDFQEDGYMYRGMAFKNYEDLKTIFTTGLLLSKSTYNNIYFSDDIVTGVDHSIQYNFGHLPVVVKMRGDHGDRQGTTVTFPSDVPAGEIYDVIVWGKIDGKKGWWRASLNNNGEVVLQPTENMETVDAASFKLNSKPDFEKYILPTMGVALLAATLSNTVTAPFALATLPLFVSTEPLAGNQSTIQSEQGISAKILFTGEYKNKKIRFYRSDIEQVKKHLPSGFEEKEAIYRGMNLSSYTDLQNILKEQRLSVCRVHS